MLKGSVVEKIGAAVLISVETATCNDYRPVSLRFIIIIIITRCHRKKHPLLISSVTSEKVNQSE